MPQNKAPHISHTLVVHAVLRPRFAGTLRVQTPQSLCTHTAPPARPTSRAPSRCGTREVGRRQRWSVGWWWSEGRRWRVVMVLCQLVLVPLLPPQYHHQKLVVTRLVCGSGVEGWWVRDGRAPRRNAASLDNTEKRTRHPTPTTKPILLSQPPHHSRRPRRLWRRGGGAASAASPARGAAPGGVSDIGGNWAHARESGCVWVCMRVLQCLSVGARKRAGARKEERGAKRARGVFASSHENTPLSLSTCPRPAPLRPQTGATPLLSPPLPCRGVIVAPLPPFFHSFPPFKPPLCPASPAAAPPSHRASCAPEAPPPTRPPSTR